MRKEFDFELVLEKNPDVPFHGMHNCVRISGTYTPTPGQNGYKVTINALRVQNSDTWIDVWPYLHHIVGEREQTMAILGLNVLTAIKSHLDYLEQSQTETPPIDAAADGH